jgi:hypothetical protein
MVPNAHVYSISRETGCDQSAFWNVAQNEVEPKCFETLRVDMHPECVSVPECWWTSVKMVVMWYMGSLLVADKVCTADAPKMFSVSSTSRWAAVEPHPHTALRYAQASNAGDIREVELFVTLR